MSQSQEILVDDFRFNGIIQPPVAASVLEGPFASKITKTAGTPVVSSAAVATMPQGMSLTLDATNEVQVAKLYFGDVLSYLIGQLISIEFWAALSASPNAAITAFFGLCNTNNDTIASITQRCIFKFVGSSALTMDCVDGTNSVTGFAPSGQTLGTTLEKFMLEFKEGVNTVSGGLSTGGKSRIIASAEGNAQNTLRWVNQNQILSMGALADTVGLQPYAQIQKTAVAAGATLTIQRIRVKYRPY
jgi:hypothetical protein